MEYDLVTSGVREGYSRLLEVKVDYEDLGDMEDPFEYIDEREDVEIIEVDPYSLFNSPVKILLAGKDDRDLCEAWNKLESQENLECKLERKTGLNVNTPLTERQQEVIETAVELGYYDLKQDTSSEDVAEEFEISHATTCGHLRRAERRIVNQVLTDQ